MKIKDLTAPLVAAKSDWLIASDWIGFTPADGSTRAKAQCESTIAGQARSGYIVEYITQSFGKPNPGHESDPRYLADRAAHKKVAGKLVGVHRIMHVARSLREIVGNDDYEWLQDTWASGAERHRWSVAFPIIESYSIPSKPLASEVLGAEIMKRVFARQSAYLRSLSKEDAACLAELEIEPRRTQGAWFAIQKECEIAARNPVDEETDALIGDDLSGAALEGMTEEQKRMIRRRAASLAHKFVLQRTRQGLLACDDCGFDPAERASGVGVAPRSLLDVHHRFPLEEGIRVTTLEDFSLLCPTCHRVAHAVLRQVGQAI